MKYIDTKRSILRKLYPETTAKDSLLELISAFENIPVVYKTIVARITGWKTIKFRQGLR